MIEASRLRPSRVGCKYLQTQTKEFCMRRFAASHISPCILCKTNGKWFISSVKVVILAPTVRFIQKKSLQKIWRTWKDQYEGEIGADYDPRKDILLEIFSGRVYHLFIYIKSRLNKITASYGLLYSCYPEIFFYPLSKRADWWLFSMWESCFSNQNITVSFTNNKWITNQTC